MHLANFLHITINLTGKVEKTGNLNQLRLLI